jgi:hypothetical protein
MFIAFATHQMILHPSGVTCFGRGICDKEGLKQTAEFVDVVNEELLLTRAQL